MSYFRYLSARERNLRILWCILASYVLLNGSQFNVVNGLYQSVLSLHRLDDGFWTFIGYGIVAIISGVLIAVIVRRLKLAKTNTDMIQLAFRTTIVAAVTAVVVAVGVKLSMDWFGLVMTTERYVKVFAWTWQIPVGYFIGSGLNWSIGNRAIAGVQTVDTNDEHHTNDIVA